MYLKKILLVAALLFGGVAGTFAMTDSAEARPRGVYRYGYRPSYGYRSYNYYRPSYGYRSYYRPYYGGYRTYGYGYPAYGYGGYGGYGYGGGVYIGRGGVSIGW